MLNGWMFSTTINLNFQFDEKEKNQNNCEEELCQNTCQNGLISWKSLNLHSFNKYNSKTQLTLNFNKLYYNVFYTILCMNLFSKRIKPIEDFGALLSIVNILNVV